MENVLSPAEILDKTIEIGVKKSNENLMSGIISGILGGLYIALGTHASLTIMQTMNNVDVGLMKFFGATVFPVGLMLIIIAGGQLFTGNTLIILAKFDKKITIRSLFKNWTVIYIANFLGAFLLVMLLTKSGLYKNQNLSHLVMKTSEAKISLTFTEAVIRGILCNVLVVLAVWMMTGAKDMLSKIFACWFPVMLFILSGFEHCIANMYYLPLAKALGADITWFEIWVNNLIPVTIGNLIGGALFIPISYYLLYKKKIGKVGK